MVLRLNDLQPAPGSKRRRKRVGRGNASGKGTYSGRGLKGQLSRSGRDYNAVFEGGAMSMFRTLPRRKGFKAPFRVESTPINVIDLARRFGTGASVDAEALVEVGLLRRSSERFKVLAGGELSHALHLSVARISPAAQAKIVAAGGSVEVLHAENADSNGSDAT